jgi:hypothetical protein
MKQLTKSEYDELMLPLMGISLKAYEILAGEYSDW